MFHVEHVLFLFWNFLQKKHPVCIQVQTGCFSNSIQAKGKGLFFLVVRCNGFLRLGSFLSGQRGQLLLTQGLLRLILRFFHLSIVGMFGAGHGDHTVALAQTHHAHTAAVAALDVDVRRMHADACG